MRNKSKIIGGIVLLALGVAFLLKISGWITIDFKGWWTVFIIIPCIIGLFNSRHKTWPLIGIGAGVLMFLAERGNIPWEDLWQYLICIVLIVCGVMLIFGHGGKKRSANAPSTDHMKEIDQDGRKIRMIENSFGKQSYEFAGQRFEGASVQNSFGFVSLDLRSADILDGAIIDVECSFGGMEIRVGNDIIVNHTVESSFAGVECKEHLLRPAAAKTLIVKGHCSFGGIEIK